MLPQTKGEVAFARRGDRSLGWKALESKQAEAIGREMAIGRVPALDSQGFALLPELSPFPPRARRQVGGRERALDIARLLLAWILALHILYLAATALLISIYHFVDPPATVLMAYRSWRYGWKIKAPRPLRLSKVPRYIRSMLIAIEDGKFYEHRGIDLEAFDRAREINKRIGRPLYGGSTLTMQVARTLFLVPEKSYLRKYLEVLTAFELEALLPKSRILELYFGYAEWGKGIFGIESASRGWYGRGVSELSRDEAARLVAILSSPIKYGPYTLRKSGILRERYAYLSRRYDPPPLPIDTSPAPREDAGETDLPGASSLEIKPLPSPEPSSADAEEGEAQPAAAP